MDERKRVPQNWKMYAAGLGACGLVASAAVTDGSVGSSPPEAVLSGGERVRAPVPAAIPVLWRWPRRKTRRG
jgi:hypothetical protein